METLISHLPPVLDMRHAGSKPCPSQPTAAMNHICVVNADPVSEAFGVLYEFVSALLSSSKLPAFYCALQCLGIETYPQCCTVMRPLDLQIDARQHAQMRNAVNGLASPDISALVYVGAIRQLYERDGVPVPECLKDEAWAERVSGEKVGMEVSVFIEVRGTMLSFILLTKAFDTAGRQAIRVHPSHCNPRSHGHGVPLRFRPAHN